MASSLPAARAAFTDKNGLPTPQFYRFLETLANAQGSNTSASDIAHINAQIAELQAEIDTLPEGGGSPRLQVVAPLISQGLLQNGFARLSWNGTTDDVPETLANEYFDVARSWMFA